jgi:hypothetical protein
VEIYRENGKVTGVTKKNIRFLLDGENPCKDCLLIIRSDSIVLTRELPQNNDINIIKGKIIEIIPSQYGMELTLDAGDLFYVNILTADFEKQKFSEQDEAWMSFPSKAIVALYGTI